MIEIILSFLFFSIISYGNGLIFNYYLNKNHIFNKEFFFNSIIGIVITSFLAQILNFFLPLNVTLLYVNFFIVIFFFYKNSIIQFKIYFKFNPTIILIFFLFIISIAKIYASGFSDDLNHYHGSHIGNTDNSNLIIGMNFLHNHFGFSSIWLILNSYYNFDGIYLQQIHILNSLTFFLVNSFLIKEIINNNKSKNKIYMLWCSIAVVFLLLKFTRLKEFGIDRGAVLIFVFYISYTIKNFSKDNKFVFILFLISLFLTLIKIFYIFSIIIPMIVIIINKNYKFFKSKYFFILFSLFFISLLKNLIISGCVIYPFKFTCIKLLSWYDAASINTLLLDIEASTKNYIEYNGTLLKQEYVKNFNWVKTWLNRNFEEVRNIILTSFLVIILTKFSFYEEKKNKYISKNKNIKMIFIILLIVNLIFFLKSPVVRYHQTLFILLSINLSFFIIKPKSLKLKSFLTIISICLIFNLSKNINRIKNENFINDPLNHIKKIRWYHEPVEKNLGKFKYYVGWIKAHPSTHHELTNLKHKKLFFFNMIYK